MMAVDTETLNLRHVNSCEMFPFCDVLHETKQKRKQILESALYGLELIFHQTYFFECKKGIMFKLHNRSISSFYFATKSTFRVVCLNVIRFRKKERNRKKN